ncbi:MAG: hypothetical protein ACREJ5_28395 [Geminicoccaceae bacterium]
MPETLLSPSNILLYGRVLADVLLQHPEVETTAGGATTAQAPAPARARSTRGQARAQAASAQVQSSSSGNPGGVQEDTVPLAPDPPPKLGANTFLQNQLTADAGIAESSPRLARIYGFSYEGHYYDLARPAIFLVHGPGNDPEATRPGTTLPESRVDRAPADADRTGVANTARSFSHDMRVWSYDKGDFSIRLDPESGPLEQILLQAELRPDKQQTYYSGQNAFVSGQNVFMSGQNVFLRGGRGRTTGD